MSSLVDSQGQSRRQTRTNPYRISKTQTRSSFAYGHPSTSEAAQDPPVSHDIYPALTHFTDAITALPREFRRHNSLLKEVDAKAWALEDNLLQLLKSSAETATVRSPPNPAPIIDGVIRDDIGPTHPPESQESKNRRLIFDRVRLAVSDLMMTADEKNHVISNANDELDRQLLRLDTIFPYIGNEISDESRLGSLTHWAYTNRNTVKAAANGRPRRVAASNRHGLHALQEAEITPREAKRETATTRKHRRTHVDSDFDDPRPHSRRTNAKGRGGGTISEIDHAATASKRRKAEQPHPADAGLAIGLSSNGSGDPAGRNAPKDAGSDTVKRRARAPNASSAARKRNTTAASTASSPALAPSPVVGTFNPQRSVASLGSNAMTRVQSSRSQNSAQMPNGRQRPPSSASDRISGKPAEPKFSSRDTPAKIEAASSSVDMQRDDTNDYSDYLAKATTPFDAKGDPEKLSESAEAGERPDLIQTIPAPKSRSSKTSTPVLATFGEAAQRARPARSTDSVHVRRSHKKRSSVSAPQPIASEDESVHGGDDEEDDTEPRYCYCNDFSFGEMVACDNDACLREWFHLSCVGMSKPPGKNVKWYCNECKEGMRRNRSGR